MSQTITGIGSSKVISNLDTYVHTCLNTSNYKVTVHIDDIPPSGITIAIKHNSTTVASTSAPASSQNHIELQALIGCTATDTVSVVLASAVALDAQPQAFKGILNISQGASS